MKTIWKYQLETTDCQSIEMPKGAQILTAQFQGSFFCLWVLVNSLNVPEKRFIEIFGTGNPIPQDIGLGRKYIATAQQPLMPLVWHVFERK